MVEKLPVMFVKRMRIWDWVWAIEPYISAEHGTYTEGLGRVFHAFAVRNTVERSTHATQTKTQDK
jgi:hypothetical protein